MIYSNGFLHSDTVRVQIWVTNKFSSRPIALPALHCISIKDTNKILPQSNVKIPTGKNYNLFVQRAVAH